MKTVSILFVLWFNHSFVHVVVQITDVRNERLPVAPSEDRQTDPVPSPVQLEPDGAADADRKPLVISDANNNGIPDRDRNASQTRSHVCQECGKTFMTKASLKVKKRKRCF